MSGGKLQNKNKNICMYNLYEVVHFIASKTVDSRGICLSLIESAISDELLKVVHWTLNFLSIKVSNTYRIIESLILLTIVSLLPKAVHQVMDFQSLSPEVIYFGHCKYRKKLLHMVQCLFSLQGLFTDDDMK